MPTGSPHLSHAAAPATTADALALHIWWKHEYHNKIAQRTQCSGGGGGWRAATHDDELGVCDSHSENGEHWTRSRTPRAPAETTLRDQDTVAEFKSDFHSAFNSFGYQWIRSLRAPSTSSQSEPLDSSNSAFHKISSCMIYISQLLNSTHS